jgi:glycine betaine/proline transport system ATP-binding protein
VLRVRSIMRDGVPADTGAVPVGPEDNLESLLARSGGDTAQSFVVEEAGKPVGRVEMDDLLRALMPTDASEGRQQARAAG